MTTSRQLPLNLPARRAQARDDFFVSPANAEAMALIDREHAAEGSELTVHVVGQPRRATVIPASPHDPSGSVMRG